MNTQEQLTDRTEKIDKILAAARRKCPPIVPAIRMRHKVTGETHSVFGMPFGFKSEDYEPVTIGFVFRDLKSNTTFGKVTESRELLAHQFERAQDLTEVGFRRELLAMDDERFASQCDYWKA